MTEEPGTMSFPGRLAFGESRLFNVYNSSSLSDKSLLLLLRVGNKMNTIAPKFSWIQVIYISCQTTQRDGQRRFEALTMGGGNSV